MRIAGHIIVTVGQRYVHPTPEAVERAFQRLEFSILSGQLPPSEAEIRQLPAIFPDASERQVAVSR
jgi:hypothetical protein